MIKPFLTFNGNAEEAMNFYAAIFPEAKVTNLTRYGKNHPYATEAEENKILFGAVSIMGQDLCFLDMNASHPAPNFNWANSIYIDCKTEAEFDGIFNALSVDGTVMMGPESVGNIRKCAWVTDKFGVTWQPVW